MAVHLICIATMSTTTHEKSFTKTPKAFIIVLKDSTPDEEEDLLQLTAFVAPGANADEEEPSPPAPFEFTG